MLLGKLKYYGIRDTTLSWFKSLLNKRTQQATKIDSSYSKYITINCGDPQGSVLGPLLILTYVNEIYLSALEVTFHLFADDTCIFYVRKNLEQIRTTLNNALNKIQ